MKNFSKLLTTIIFLAAFALTATAQAKADLIVSAAAVSKDPQNFIKSISVRVTNFCQAADAKNTYVLVTVKQSAEKTAPTLYQIGIEIPLIKGGETVSKTLEISDKKIGANRFMLIEVDPYKKVAEADENNNWRTLNPTGAGAKLSGQFQCSPKE
jgi:hypothetical protein